MAQRCMHIHGSKVRDAVRDINATASLLEAERAEVPLEQLIDLGRANPNPNPNPNPSPNPSPSPNPNQVPLEQLLDLKAFSSARWEAALLQPALLTALHGNHTVSCVCLQVSE